MLDTENPIAMADEPQRQHTERKSKQFTGCFPRRRHKSTTKKNTLQKAESGMGENMEKYRKARRLHDTLFIQLDGLVPFHSHHFKRFKRLCKSYLDDTAEQCVDTLDLLSGLEMRNRLGLGKYDGLKDLLDDFPVALEAVRKYEQGTSSTLDTPNDTGFKVVDNSRVNISFCLTTVPTDPAVTQLGEAVLRKQIEQQLTSYPGCVLKDTFMEEKSKRTSRDMERESIRTFGHMEISSIEGFLRLWIHCLDMTFVHDLSYPFLPTRLMLRLEMAEGDYCRALRILGDKLNEGENSDKVELLRELLERLQCLIEFADFRETLRDTIKELSSKIGTESCATHMPGIQGNTERKRETSVFGSFHTTRVSYKKTAGSVAVKKEISRGFFEHAGTSKPVSSELQFDESNATMRRKSQLFRSYCKKKTEDSFVVTTLCKRAASTLGSNNTLLVIGGTGDGKSSILRYLAANTDFFPVQCSKPSDVEVYIYENIQGSTQKLLFVLDDAFGRLYLQDALVNEWDTMAEKIEMHLDPHKFVFATRKLVWADCKSRLQKSPFFRNRFDVTSANLTTEDKRRLLQNYIEDIAILTKDELESIVRTEKPIAYIQCCKLAAEGILKGWRTGVQIVEIFEKPFPFLRDELQNLADNEKDKYATLCFVMLCGGQLKCEQLADPSSDVSDFTQRIRDTCDSSTLTCGGMKICADKLTGTFLERVQKLADSSALAFYQFSNKSMYEATIMMYGREHFLQCSKFLHRDTIVRIVRPQNYVVLDQECAINITEDYYKYIAMVFTETAISGSWGLHDVFHNPCIRDLTFQRSWCDFLDAQPRKLMALSRSTSWDGQCTLHLAKASRATKLREYLDQHGIRCTCRTEQHPLSQVASQDNTVLLVLILKAEKTSNDEICIAMGFACRSGGIKALGILYSWLSRGRRDEAVERCLGVARESGRQEIERYLLSCKRRSRGRRDEAVERCLGVARESGCQEMEQHLLSCKRELWV